MTASAFRILRPTTRSRITGASLATAIACGLPARLASQAEASADPRGQAAEASRALEEGRPYRATRLLAPLVEGPGAHDPELVLLAARAAAGWEGWGTVTRLLAREPWLDQREGGEGRALLARARLERGDSSAVDDAEAAVRTAEADDAGARLVTLARALDRADLIDSAARVYNRAAALLPSIADWLRLRAAGVTADSATRASLFREVSHPAATQRIGWTEALARERTGDLAGAARVYESLGATLPAIRLRLGTKPPPDSAARAALRLALLDLLGPRGSADDARGAIALLDQSFGPLTRDLELAIARRAESSGPLLRAAEGFARAAAAKPLDARDRLAYGGVLARLGRHREAMAIFRTVQDRAFRPAAEYQRARSLLALDRRKDAMAVLRRVFTGFRYDTATAAAAGFLDAELLVDDRNDAKARSAYLEVARRFPRTGHGARAALQAGLLAFVHGDTKSAAKEFTALAERPVPTAEAAAALYWAGRAREARGDSAGARARWRAVRDRYPASYYAMAAAGRLGSPPIDAPPPGDLPPPDPQTNAALTRGELLEAEGLWAEARFEYDYAARGAEATPAALLAAARAFAGRDLTARAYRLALRAADRSAEQNVGLERLLFPLPRKAALLAEAREAGVDPLLASAIIRQESAFDPNARSVADARGLLQVMPAVGAGLARSEGLRDWDPAALYQPELNLHFGLLHLAEMLKRYPRLEAALAAYNAGRTVADRWLALPGAARDPEVFIERVQFAETRDYLRRVLRNLATYRTLYPVLP